ncbi:hypothetical protein BST96_08880 [Oceanicoccus sagamiensis]|uniref:Porin n=1 Tax=Oceanicoccus sagamiensis TaxID=716816 RepID=A0A1X9NEA7_9GAMM|nr:hypothetical protein BST96_08880 [Oceanicoccus sagamiensis]
MPLLALLILWLPLLPHAGAEALLIRNVQMINQGEEQRPLVSIVIKDNKLDLVSEDTIPIDQVDRAYDAAGGTLLGNLEPGQPASFLILANNSMDDIEKLMDTKRYARFAIYEGELLKNFFRRITVETAEGQAAAKQGWLAYAAPPIAVPLNYRDSTRWNKYEGEWVSGLFAGAIMLDRQRWLDQDRSSERQVGDLTQEYEGGEIRGLRFGGVGTLNFAKPWVWTAFAATHAFDSGFDATDDDDFTLYDLRLDIPLWEKASFSIGKQKEPISMERIMSLTQSPMQERAAVSDALLPARNVGMVVASNFLGDRMTLAGGVFNNWLDKDQPNSLGDNATQYIGRLTWLPIESKQQSTTMHLAMAMRHSNGKEGLFAATDPEFNNAPDFVDTGIFTTDEFTTYQAEASLRSGPFWLHGEYTRTEADTGPGDNEYDLDGFHLTGSWIVTGEMRPYNYQAGIFGGVPIAKSVEQNGWGALELSLRYSELDLSEYPTDSGKMDIWSAGANWMLTPYMYFTLNYRYITLDRYGEEGDTHGLNTRLVLLLE